MAGAARSGDDQAAGRCARAILRVDEARRAAAGNNNPQLITATRLADLSN
jgi:hypothetical protein